jgi:hypothetical protein
MGKIQKKYIIIFYFYFLLKKVIYLDFKISKDYLWLPVVHQMLKKLEFLHQLSKSAE